MQARHSQEPGGRRGRARRCGRRSSPLGRDRHARRRRRPRRKPTRGPATSGFVERLARRGQALRRPPRGNESPARASLPRRPHRGGAEQGRRGAGAARWAGGDVAAPVRRHRDLACRRPVAHRPLRDGGRGPLAPARRAVAPEGGTGLRTRSETRRGGPGHRPAPARCPSFEGRGDAGALASIAVYTGLRIPRRRPLALRPRAGDPRRRRSGVATRPQARPRRRGGLTRALAFAEAGKLDEARSAADRVPQDHKKRASCPRGDVLYKAKTAYNEAFQAYGACAADPGPNQAEYAFSRPAPSPAPIRTRRPSLPRPRRIAFSQVALRGASELPGGPLATLARQVEGGRARLRRGRAPLPPPQEPEERTRDRALPTYSTRTPARPAGSSRSSPGAATRWRARALP